MGMFYDVIDFKTLKKYEPENDCGFWRHDWSGWSPTDQLIIRDDKSYAKRGGVIKKEKRGCLKCGKIKRRERTELW